MLITDWWPEPIKTFDGPQNAKTLRDAVKQMASDIKFHSALINGKGTRPDPTSETEGQTEILQCRCGENESPVVLRVIHVGITWTLKIQVAGHQLK